MQKVIPRIPELMLINDIDIVSFPFYEVIRNIYIKRYLPINGSIFLNYVAEQGITNGLGYSPIKEEMGERKRRNTQEDLTRHLGNMELSVLERENMFDNSVLFIGYAAIGEFEDAFKNAVTNYGEVLQSLEEVKGIAQEHMAKHHAPIQDLKDPQKDLKKEEQRKHWYKRIL